jgi:hypothetical protein
MRLRRTRRGNLILLSTRPVPAPGWQYTARLARRRRTQFIRTGALLAVVGVMRLARTARSRWRISLGLCGMLLEVLGHTVCTGPARGTADLLGLVVIAVAVLKSTGPAETRRPALPQTAWRWHG